MKIKKILICSFCVLQFSQAVFAKGQEVGGGDLYALMFVKIGRLIVNQLESNPLCRLEKSISKQRLKKAIEKMQIETGDQEIRFQNHVILDRTEWTYLPANDKIRTMLGIYLKQDFRNLRDSDISTCLPSNLRSQVFIGGDYPGHIPNGDIGSEAKALSQNLLKLVKHHQAVFGLRSVQMKRFEDSVNRAEFSNSPVPILFKGPTLKDGLNSRENSSYKIELDDAAWAGLAREQKIEFLFHELLGLAKVDDLRYSYSSRMFLLASND